MRNSTTVLLRKPIKNKYAVSKAYRPIALLDTIAKALELIVAKTTTCLGETYHLLSSTHVGEIKARSTEPGIHYLLERVH